MVRVKLTEKEKEKTKKEQKTRAEQSRAARRSGKSMKTEDKNVTYVFTFSIIFLV